MLWSWSGVEADGVRGSQGWAEKGKGGHTMTASTLNDNAILTDEQCAETYNHFRECLEQAAATQAHAIAWGE